MTSSLQLAAVSYLAVSFGAGANFPNPGTQSNLTNGQSSVTTVRVIKSDQPYNSDQNTMDFSYQVTQDEFGKTMLFVTLKSRLEIGTAGTQVYNMMGFQNPRNNNNWDYLRCAINFDGAVNANANSRYWVISDHYSDRRPYEAGVISSSVKLDETQDWKSTGSGQNYTECPPLAKCIFQCSASRLYETKNDKEDYQFFDGATKVNFYYGIYYQSTMLA